MPALSPNEIRTRAITFAQNWQSETRERAEKDSFWNEFFQIFGIERRRVAIFEHSVKKSRQASSFIDVFWKGRLLCEHKSAGKNLDEAAEQAFAYLEQIEKIASQDLPRYIIVSDFARMRLQDIETDSVIEFDLTELPAHLGSFGFMNGVESEIKAAEEAANIQAAEAIGALYAVLKAWHYEEHALKQFIIRLLFCFFAEDTGIFNPAQFEHYLKRRTAADGSDTAAKLNELFHVLNTPSERRMKNLDDDLAAFPYVNGKLFEEYLPPAAFDSEMRTQLLECCHRDWSKISPEIFGSLFQSVMDSQERRDLGAHYTEETNILKVIDSLFLNDLRQAFSDGLNIKNRKKRHETLDAFHHKIATLTFLDPACGCGNFLVVAYRKLRELELDLVSALYDKDQLLDINTIFRCHIGQFYGIEIDEYPAQIAKVAMWLTDHQCNLEAAERFGQTRPSIPLNDSAVIQNANALQTEWPQTDFIFGNPPFIGRTYRSKEQQNDLKAVFPKTSAFGQVDYVGAWYVKATRIMQAKPQVQAAFVSTNSICQGEQAAVLWAWMFEQNIEIYFAHRTFQWTSGARGKAAVHCVIVGFAVCGKQSEATNSSKQQQTAANSSKQQQTAANSSKQQQTAANSSKQQQTAANKNGYLIMPTSKVHLKSNLLPTLINT